jgi:hypothetical protein
MEYSVLGLLISGLCVAVFWLAGLYHATKTEIESLERRAAHERDMRLRMAEHIAHIPASKTGNIIHIARRKESA